MKKRVVIYTRVSSKKIEQEKSLISQEEIYTEYCKKNGYELVGIYAEKGMTGTNSRRPQFKQLLFDGGVDVILNPIGNDIFNESDRKPLYDIIICKDVSRWSRNSTDGIAAVERLLSKGVIVVFENSGVSSGEEGYQFTLGILFTIAQNESQNLSRRVKFTKKHNAKSQKYQPSRVSYGYTRNEDNKIVIDDLQAQVIKFIYKRYLEVGSHIISKELNQMNIKTQMGHQWSPDKITRIIISKTNTGNPIVNRSTKKSVTDVKRSKNNAKEFIEIKNACDPIVTIEEWEEVNRIRESRINKSKRVGRKPSRGDKYFEKVYCTCGNRFVRHVGTGNKINYICQSRRKNLGCKIRGVSIGNLNKHMEEVEFSTLFNNMGDSIYYNELIQQMEKQKKRLNLIKKGISIKIDALEEDNKSTLQAVKQAFKGGNNPSIREMLMEDIESNEKLIYEHNQHLDKLNVESIEKIKNKVEYKRDTIEELSKVKILATEDKIKLLNKIIVSDYELEYLFSVPSYEDEVLDFNQLFPMNPIEMDIPFRPFTNIFRRNHKDSREFWNEIDESSREEY